MFIINSICNLHVCILYAIFQKFLTAPTAYCLDYLANEFAVGNSKSGNVLPSRVPFIYSSIFIKKIALHH